MKLFLHFVQLRLKERMEYRAAFFIGIAGLLINYGSGLLVIRLLMVRFQSMNGWEWPEIALLYSLNLFTYALGASVLAMPMQSMDRLIVEGTLDHVLVKPVNPMLILCGKYYNHYLPHLTLSSCVFVWAVAHVSIQWTLIKGIYLVLVVIGSAMLQAGFFLALGSCAFLLQRNGALIGLFHTLRELNTYPISVFGVFIQILYTFFIPFAFINFYPALFLLHKSGGGLLPAWVGWIVPLVGPLFLYGVSRMWKFGIQRYQGAGG